MAEEQYRLVFRGELLEGQHAAVVRKKLGAAMKLDNDALDRLFSGRPVVVRKAADTQTAAKFQAVFKQSGARLRIMPVADRAAAAGADDAAAGGLAGPPAADARATDAGVGDDEAGSATAPGVADLERKDSADAEGAGVGGEGATMAVLPTDSPLSGPDRQEHPAAEIATEHLTLAPAGAELGVGNAGAFAPLELDLAHLTVAAPGTALGIGVGTAVPELVFDTEWEVAGVGADLGVPAPEAVPAVDLNDVKFDVAPPGSRLAESRQAPAPPAPDTSHLTVREAD